MKILLTMLMFISFKVYADRPCDVECQKGNEKIEKASEISAVNTIWIKPYSLNNQCESYPYFPEGGLNSAYCFIKTYIPISAAETLSGHKVFLSSPHTEDSIVRSTEEFGHYNPEFLKWGIDNILPVVENKTVQEVVKSTYETFFSYSAKTYYMVWLQLQENSEENSGIRLAIKNKIKRKEYYGTDSYYSFLHEDYYSYPKLKWSGNIAKTAVPFWIRREIDGTADYFIQALEKVFNEYDPEFMEFVSNLSHNKSLKRSANAPFE